MTSEDEWTWKFAPRATDQFDNLTSHIQDRIVTKLDEVIGSEWRDPSDYLDPLTGGPFEKLRVGQYRSRAFSTTRCVFSFTASNTEAERTRRTTKPVEVLSVSRTGS
jgi:mRNA interferase RelE/StbE